MVSVEVLVLFIVAFAVLADSESNTVVIYVAKYIINDIVVGVNLDLHLGVTFLVAVVFSTLRKLRLQGFEILKLFKIY